VYALAGKRVYVAGHKGMVGSALVRRLEAEDCTLLTADRAALDLTDQAAVRGWMQQNRPQAMFIAAARVGGILANALRPADFLFENLMIETNLIQAAHESGVEKLLFLGSSCIYPRLAPSPIGEDALLTGPLEPTNDAYAIAKIAGIKLVEAFRTQHGDDFISAMPSNLYGPGDNFDLETGHVVAALIRKTHEARIAGKPLILWGSGTPLREFLFVDDLADACIFLMTRYSDVGHVNVGTGEELSIAELASMVCEIVGYSGPIEPDLSKPDGAPRKLMDVGKLSGLGWHARTPLREGLALSYRWFLEHCIADA
jgi:GDP-L-fucose synthase